MKKCELLEAFWRVENSQVIDNLMEMFPGSTITEIKVGRRSGCTSKLEGDGVMQLDGYTARVEGGILTDNDDPL